MKDPIERQAAIDTQGEKDEQAKKDSHDYHIQRIGNNC